MKLLSSYFGRNRKRQPHRSEDRNVIPSAMSFSEAERIVTHFAYLLEHLMLKKATGRSIFYAPSASLKYSREALIQAHAAYYLRVIDDELATLTLGVLERSVSCVAPEGFIECPDDVSFLAAMELYQSLKEQLAGEIARLQKERTLFNVGDLSPTSQVIQNHVDAGIPRDAG